MHAINMSCQISDMYFLCQPIYSSISTVRVLVFCQAPLPALHSKWRRGLSPILEELFGTVSLNVSALNDQLHFTWFKFLFAISCEVLISSIMKPYCWHTRLIRQRETDMSHIFKIYSALCATALTVLKRLLPLLQNWKVKSMSTTMILYATERPWGNSVLWLKQSIATYISHMFSLPKELPHSCCHTSLERMIVWRA